MIKKEKRSRRESKKIILLIRRKRRKRVRRRKKRTWQKIIHIYIYLLNESLVSFTSRRKGARWKMRERERERERERGKKNHHHYHHHLFSSFFRHTTEILGFIFYALIYFSNPCSVNGGECGRRGRTVGKIIQSKGKKTHNEIRCFTAILRKPIYQKTNEIIILNFLFLISHFFIMFSI